MSCPDWVELLAARERAPEADPPGWSAARAHFAGCPACRRRASALDPTLLFLGLPARDEDAGEVAAMQSAVAALVRARRFEAETAPARPARWRRAALAAAVLVALAVEAGPRRSTPVASGEVAAESSSAALFASPVVEQVERPAARVYQLPAEGLSVVMIVDASLDV